MIEIKIQCDCGQRYKFDVDPLNGRMPSTVNCPVCGLDGTARANALIQQIMANPAAKQFTKTMQEKHKTPPSAGFNLKLGDIYHVLFRHKWKILSVWTLGIVASIGLYLTWPVPYSSQAMLYVRYVRDDRPINSIAGDQNIQSATSGADSVINTESEMLKSLDVAKETVEMLGPEFLAKLKGGTNTYRAAANIQYGLNVDTLPRSAVMHVYFQEQDPELVQPVLTQIIESYRKAHRRAHQVGNGQDENLTMSTDKLRGDLAETEGKLRELQKTNDVTSLPETKKLNAEMKARISEDLWAAETELEEHQAVLNSVAKAASTKTETNAPAPQAAAPDDKLNEYQNVCALLDTLQKRKNQLHEYFTDQNPRVRAVLEQIESNQKIKVRLESEYPTLTAHRITSTNSGGQPEPGAVDIAGENNKILALKTKIARLNDHLKETKDQIDKVSAVEEKIRDLERLRDTQEANLATFEKKRFEKSIEEELNDENIKVIQKPSPPYTDPSKRNRILRLVLAGSIAAGLALAFAIEFYFDRSFKRPIEIETKLGLPLFLSIPETNRNGKHRLATRKIRLLAARNDIGKNQAPASSSPSEPTEVASWKPNPAMQPFFEALRDRLITHFEVKEINHKPKLVAITSCAEGSGVSTVASGLAASLSETGEGNVLLVDMNIENGSAHFFQDGKLACGLDEVLEKDANRESAQVEKNLFVVAENTADEKLPRILHKRFSALIPKLHASDFDYIIFDMPPVSQTSATTRVARFMDMVFMVVEAEKTDSDIVKHATHMLAEAKAGTVGVVLNKSHNYVPQRLSQEL
jgi:succinoglycan biosynthesis transport protein ExoP